VTEKSGNLRNDLKKDILKAVSSLRKEFSKIRSEVDDKNKLIANLEMKAVETNITLKALWSGVGSNCRVDQEVTSLGLQANSKDSNWNVALSAGRMRMHYSDIVANGKVMCLMIIKCTYCLLNFKIIKVHNTPGPYLSQ
jgi:hypothetical protein